MTAWQRHKEKWSNCERCALSKVRQRVVLLGGLNGEKVDSLPCDVVFIGEGPGQSEDVIGKPFVGPAGHLLAELVEDAKQMSGVDPTVALTNLIACIPLEDNKVGEPPDFAVLECAPRLFEIIKICKPKLIVLVGKHAREWYPALLEAAESYRGLSRSIPASKKRKVGKRGLAFDKIRSLGQPQAEPFKPKFGTVEIDHPAFILRSDVTQQGLMKQRCIVALSDAFEDFVK